MQAQDTVKDEQLQSSDVSYNQQVNDDLGRQASNWSVM